ncbi:MAG: S46 family peptidase [Saprospiraceae bacterium]|jgi:hypothetical protein|nr:S46 family peptidase [Saprospiraceae bacterium]
MNRGLILKAGQLFWICIFFSFSLFGGEGMWLPQLLKALNEKEMKSMGMKLSADDIYSINKGSLKDAIVHFGGFCTSEIVSPNGLLLTNHHCGYGQIQSHSTVENNLIKNGFWAKNYKEELPNEGLTATLIDYIDDVTEKALLGVTPGMNAGDRQSLIESNIANIRKSYSLESYQQVVIRPFYDGNQYFAFVTTVFRDVRLVGAPPESIGKFGSDTDNWVWPRHTGDFSLFRIYAGKDNKPADYSPDNVPYVPKHFLPVSMDGIEVGDFTMVFGFPGKTNQYLPASAVNQIITTLNPAKITIRDKALKITDKYMRADEATKIKYAAKYASIANYWKKWIGESQGLKQTNALGEKQAFEAEFTRRLSAESPYSAVLLDLNRLYQEIEPYALANDYVSEILFRNVDLTSTISSVRRLVNEYDKKGESGYLEMLPKVSGMFDNFYPDFDAKIDQEKLTALLDLYVKGVAPSFIPSGLKGTSSGKNPDFSIIVEEMYNQSLFSSSQKVSELFEQSADIAVKKIKTDPLYLWVGDWLDLYNRDILTPYTTLKKEIDAKQALYTKAQLELFPEIRFYPDANSTLRVTYGKVEGYQPKDAVTYQPVTYLDGIIEKYIPGDYEFDVQPRMLELYNSKNFGIYADKSGKLPVCFIGSNHTTGGNSGSPAIDAEGNLIGLNFDRVWEGTMSDIHYDVSICRNIMVDVRYILWVIDKYAGAGHLVSEMKLTHPKTGKKKR